jgi:ankyrin repeat protein
VVLGDKSAPYSLSSFALQGKSAYIGVFVNFLTDKNEQDSNGTSALHIAAKGGHLGCVYRLVQAGATVNIQDNQVGVFFLSIMRRINLGRLDYAN